MPAPLFAWWNDAWGVRVKVTFDNSAHAENLVNFPVLIRLDSSRVKYFRTQDAGQDIRFVDADDRTVLAHEIETWNEAGSSYVWVRVPQVDASSITDFIWMYYGNVNAADGQNATGVWSNGYRGVWHLKENPAAAPPQFQDLFNGKDLAGWKVINGDPGTWAWRDGMVVTTGLPIGVMCSERMYENFVLHVEWMHLVAGDNSGFSDGESGVVPVTIPSGRPRFRTRRRRAPASLPNPRNTQTPTITSDRRARCYAKSS